MELTANTELTEIIYFVIQGEYTGTLQYITSQRKRPLLIINDYLYRRNRQDYWRCIRSTSAKCRASLILKDNEYVSLCITEHSHDPEFEKLKNREIRDLDASVLQSMPEPKRNVKNDQS